MARGLSKDPSKTWKTREQTREINSDCGKQGRAPLHSSRVTYRNFSDTEIVLRVAKPNEPFAVLLASVTA